MQNSAKKTVVIIVMKNIGLILLGGQGHAIRGHSVLLVSKTPRHLQTQIRYYDVKKKKNLSKLKFM